jgi:cullin 1
MTLAEMVQISEVTGAVAEEDVEMSEAKSVHSDQQAP